MGSLLINKYCEKGRNVNNRVTLPEKNLLKEDRAWRYHIGRTRKNSSTNEYQPRMNNDCIVFW